MRIFCFGASNTYGFDPQSMFGGRYEAKDRWTDILAEAHGWEVINVGVNGREIPKNEFEWSSFNAMIKAREPLDAVLVMLGTNDILMGLTSDEVNKRMRTFMENIECPHERILLITPPPMKVGAWVQNEMIADESRVLSRLYEATAKEIGVNFFDPGELELAYDGVHMTKSANHVFAERVYKVITEIFIPSDN